MSKAAPKVLVTSNVTPGVSPVTSIKPVNSPLFTPPTYVAGEKVYYTWNGRQLPCIIVSVQQSLAAKDATEYGIAYTVQGDIRDGSYPQGAPKGPWKTVTYTQLSDRT